jgi:hypothetical protein
MDKRQREAGIMGRYSNPETEDRLDRIAAVDLEVPTRR